MLRNEIGALCKTLKLGQRVADNSQLIQEETNEAFLVSLFQTEVEQREAEAKTRLLKKACFGSLKTFDGYEFDQIQMPKGVSPEELQTLSFLDHCCNLVLYGKVGAGKSHMATAIGVLACQKGKRVLFKRTSTLVNQLVEAKKEGRLIRFLKSFESLQLLILDEFGFVPLDREGGQLLFQLISDCYEKISIIITTNLEFSRWVNVIGDESMTSAMIDRIIHHGYLLIFNRDSYRLKNSLMKE